MTHKEELEARQEELEARQEEIENELLDFFPFDDLDEYCCEMSPTDIFNRFFHGNISGWRPDMIKVNGYANFDDGDAEYNELQDELDKIEEELDEIEEKLEEIEEELEDLDE